jgi:hypothetical protein
MRVFEWAIEDIIVAHPELYLEHCALMAVALMSRQSVRPCEFRVAWECLWLEWLHFHLLL